MPRFSLKNQIILFYLSTLELEAHELHRNTMAAHLSGAVGDLGEFLIDLFVGGKSLDSELKSSESSQSSALVNLRNQEDIRLFTEIFVLQLLEQRYLLERRPIAKSSRLYLEILVLSWDRYETLFRMSPEIMNRLVNNIEDHEVFLRFASSNREIPIYTQATAGNSTSKGRKCRLQIVEILANL